MKIQITFKDPDNRIHEEIEALMRKELYSGKHITEEEFEELGTEEIEEKFLEVFDMDNDDIYSKINKFVKYGEYVTIEVDLKEETGTVVPVGR